MKQLSLIKASLKNATAESFDLWAVLFSGLVHELIAFFPLQIALFAAAGNLKIPSNDLIISYSYTRLVLAVYRMFLSGIEKLPSLVLTGGLDVYLILPIHWIMAAMFSQFNLSAIGSMLMSIVLLATAIGDMERLLLLVMLLPLSLLILGSLFLVISLITGFWWVDPRNTMITIIDRITDFYRYPIDIYPAIIKQIIWLFPTATVFYIAIDYLRTGVIYSSSTQLTILTTTLLFPVILTPLARRRYKGAGS